VVFDSHQFSDAAGRLVHFFLRGAAVFQCKGDIFRHRQADELAVRILQHGADMIRQLKNAAVGRIHAVYCQAACTLTGVGEGIQAIDAGRQRAFAAAGRPGDQHTLTGVDIQVDIMQGGLLLGAVLERKIFEGYDGCFGLCHTAPRREIVVVTAKCLPAFVGRHTGVKRDYSLSREPFLAMVLV
jgi:hypothetical protein